MLTCFKAYDVRGRVPDDLASGVAYRMDRASMSRRAAMPR